MKKRLIATLLLASLAISSLTACSVTMGEGEDKVTMNFGQTSENDSDNTADTETSETGPTEAPVQKPESQSNETPKETENVSNNESHSTSPNKTEGTTDKNSETQGTSTSINTNWKNYEFSVNGQTLSVPCSYNELKVATGWAMKSSYEKSFLESGYYALVNMYAGDELTLYTEVTNNAKEDMQYPECDITKVAQSAYMIENGASPITFPGGLVAGQKATIEELKELFGEPTDVYEYTSDDSDYWSNTYTWSEDETWTSYDYIEIVIKNGIIDQIDLQHLEK